MKKLSFSILSLLIVIVAGCIIISYFKSSQTKDVEDYLQAQEYHTSDILSIRTEMVKAPLFNTKVIFKDEEKVIYYYWKVQDKIHQGTPEVLGINLHEQDSYLYKHKER